MEFDSVWRGKEREYPRLESDIVRDIVVIGGGIAGFLTAFRLAEAGESVTLIEADRLFSGTTGRTTAKITCNQGGVYAELFARYGMSAAALYYKSQAEGMRRFANLVQRYSIACDWKETDSYIFSHTLSHRLESARRVMERAGAACEWKTGADVPFGAACALKLGKQYLFDPLRFLSALPVGFEVYEHTRAVKIDAEHKTVQTESGTIQAKILIVATRFPVVNSHGGYFLKLRQSSSYVLAVSRKTEGMYLEEREDGLSVRPYAGGTIVGGEDHRTGRTAGGHFKNLEERVFRVLGATAEEVTHRWCAEDVMTFDKIPMAGRYAKNLGGVYVVTGFNKWGMANAMVCADILRDCILGRENLYAALFSPQRQIGGSLGAFLSNAATNVKGIVSGYFGMTFKTAADIPPGSGKVVRYQGKRRAVYRDESGKLYAIGRMCPHMHCELSWNGDTKTWDCPCHGSRFDIYGNILSGPAVKRCKCEAADADKNDGEDKGNGTV